MSSLYKSIKAKRYKHHKLVKEAGFNIDTLRKTIYIPFMDQTYKNNKSVMFLLSIGYNIQTEII